MSSHTFDCNSIIECRKREYKLRTHCVKCLMDVTECVVINKRDNRITTYFIWRNSFDDCFRFYSIYSTKYIYLTKDWSSGKYCWNKTGPNYSQWVYTKVKRFVFFVQKSKFRWRERARARPVNVPVTKRLYLEYVAAVLSTTNDNGIREIRVHHYH